GGVQLTRLGEALENTLAIVVAATALLAAAVAICFVLVRATSVLKVPFADLSEVLEIRNLHYTDKGWNDEEARKRWERGAQAVSAATGGRLSEISELHDEVQHLRTSHREPDKALLASSSQVARHVVADVNRAETEHRFDKLKNSYIRAAIIVFIAVGAFVGVTSTPGAVSVKEPVSVRIIPEDGNWPSPLGKCSAGELLGVAISGSWPQPDVSIPSSKGCKSALISDASGLIVVPLMGDDPAASRSKTRRFLKIARPTQVVIQRTGRTWYGTALAGCKARMVRGVAIGGMWARPDVVTFADPTRECPAALVTVDGDNAVAVPVARKQRR
ncbi:MAG: hypothetical protein M3271_00305, partial [Actinomycetota bacterium]|nr:hypothetical protein [Actinomycetota bacterium]